MARVAGVDAGEALDAHGEVFVGIGPIDHPPAVAGGVAGGEAEAAVELREVGVLGADEVELAAVGEFGGRPVFPVTDAAAEALREGGGDE